jgi:hypothetical protein
MKFKHLDENDQDYFSHFKDAIHYSLESFKCSIYFLCHAVYPDKFIKNGSEKITKLNDEIKEKYRLIRERQK